MVDPVRRGVSEAMGGGYIYCLYSTQDGAPRYIGQTSDKVSYAFRHHVTAALEKEDGPLYAWIREVWHREHDINFYVLQARIAPKDLDMFEAYWVSQFAGLLNTVPGSKQAIADSHLAQQIKAVLAEQLRLPVSENPIE